MKVDFRQKWKRHRYYSAILWRLIALGAYKGCRVQQSAAKHQIFSSWVNQPPCLYLSTDLHPRKCCPREFALKLITLQSYLSTGSENQSWTICDFFVQNAFTILTPNCLLFEEIYLWQLKSQLSSVGTKYAWCFHEWCVIG